jgi:ABC-type dipeptide/oligopeptide/nickel transport system ATPase subunit
MVEYVKVIDHKNLRRQRNSKGVVNIDNEELNKYKVEREYKNKISIVVQEHDKMKNDIEEIKNLLKELLGKV